MIVKLSESCLGIGQSRSVTQPSVKWVAKPPRLIAHLKMQLSRILKCSDCYHVALFVLADPMPNGILDQRLEHQ